MKSNLIVVLSLLFIALITGSLGVCFASQNWVNQTVQVRAGGSTYWSGTLYQGNSLHGSFTVNSGGDIKFYILDAANYAKYSNGQTFISYYKNQAVQVPQVDFTVPYDGTWFVLLDNSYSSWYSKTVTVTLAIDSSSTDGVSGIPIGTWVILGLVGIVFLGIIVYGVNESQKRQRQPTFYPTQISKQHY